MTLQAIAPQHVEGLKLLAVRRTHCRYFPCRRVPNNAFFVRLLDESCTQGSFLFAIGAFLWELFRTTDFPRASEFSAAFGGSLESMSVSPFVRASG